MITIDMKDVGVSLDNFAYQAGETTEQATYRFGVAAARGLATETAPRKKSVAQLKKRTRAQMHKVCMEVKSAVYFRKLARGIYSRIKMSDRWTEVRPDRIVENAAELDRVIERHRDQRGRTKPLRREERYVCKRADFNKVVRDRAKRWGVAKGAWLGAGDRISRMQKGLDRNTIGKNFLRFAQRHKKAGTGYRMGESHKTSVFLQSKAQAAAYSEGLDMARTRSALRRAQKSVFTYYKAEIRRREKLKRR